MGRRAPVLIFCIAVSRFCVPALVSFLLSVLVGGHVDFSSDFKGVEEIDMWGTSSST